MRRIVLCLFAIVLVFVVNAGAQETTLTVRAKANDAKFIGTAMSGVQVSITQANTGEMLAQGIISGGTGSTETLMEQPVARGQRISNEDAAAFKTVLDIDVPTPLNIRVHGPLAGGTTSVDASKSVWLLPGEDIVGDGIVFNLYGFVVVPLTPHANTKVDADKELHLRAYVTMLCGCPITPGGMWNADKYTVEAQIWNADTLVERVPMHAGSEDGVFSATYVPHESGSYRVIFTASDTEANNYGVAYTGIAVK